MTWDDADLPTRLLLRDVEVEGRRVDVRVVEDVVAEVAVGLAPTPRDEVVEGSGGALLPGLHDHHIHLRGLAAARLSVACGPEDVVGAEGFAAALRAAEPRDGWVRAVGYHESVAGPLDRDRLDRVRSEVAVRVQHASGLLWAVNSTGADRLGLDSAEHPGVERDARGRATGVLHRADDWLRSRLPSRPPDLSDTSRELGRLGVTGVTDASATNGEGDLAKFATARAEGRLLQDLLVLGAGEMPPGPGVGAVKLVLDEHDLPGLEALTATITASHAGGRPVAVHAVTLASLVLAAAALRAAGAREGDRVEHASVCPPELAADLADLGLAVVTQPVFVADRGDRYLREVDVDDQPWLYPCRLLADSGVALAGSSDAPYGDPDPWRGIAAAIDRSTRGGAVVGADQGLRPEDALRLYLAPLHDPGGPSRRVAAGAPARLCLLAAPLTEALRSPSADLVRLVTLGGRLFQRDP